MPTSLPRRAGRAVGVLALLVGAACAQGANGDRAQRDAEADAGGSAEARVTGASDVLARGVAGVDAAAAAADSLFQPLPLLRPAQESSLRSFGNAAQLERARAIGPGRALSADEIERHVEAGRLLRLEDSAFWVIGDLDHSQPLVVPEVRELLTEIGQRFQAQLGELGAPPFRFEISSLLRTAADQAALREVNPNAALGESTHEYGTTVDVLYSAFAAPESSLGVPELSGSEWARPFLDRYAEIAAERVAARRALELKAILGEVLLELQGEGRVMVTLERLQPVFHMTVARAER